MGRAGLSANGAGGGARPAWRGGRDGSFDQSITSPMFSNSANLYVTVLSCPTLRNIS